MATRIDACVGEEADEEGSGGAHHGDRIETLFSLESRDRVTRED